VLCASPRDLNGTKWLSVTRTSMSSMRAMGTEGCQSGNTSIDTFTQTLSDIPGHCVPAAS